MHCPHAVESWSDILPSIKEKNGTGRKSNVVSSMDLDHISDDKFIDALDRAADRYKDYWTGSKVTLRAIRMFTLPLCVAKTIMSKSTSEGNEWIASCCHVGVFSLLSMSAIYP